MVSWLVGDPVLVKRQPFNGVMILPVVLALLILVMVLPLLPIHNCGVMDRNPVSTMMIIIMMAIVLVLAVVVVVVMDP